MDRGRLQVYFGSGRGKTTAALGQAVRAASRGKTVIIVQFLKGRQPEQISFIQRLEPEIKIFHFEKSEERYEELSEQEKTEENRNIKNGLNFARKVLLNDECSLLVLDELLGVIDNGVVTKEDVKALFEAKSEEAQIIVTGRRLPDYMRELADEIYQIQTQKTQDS